MAMNDILLSSDFGLRWGNYALTPEELANKVAGIDLIDGLLVFDGIKWGNTRDGEEYLVDQNNVRRNLRDLFDLDHENQYELDL